VLRPFSAYLRVYEPLSAFGHPPDQRLVNAVSTDPLNGVTAGERERILWLKSQTAESSQLLPAESIGGGVGASVYKDVLVLDPADVPAQGGVEDAADFGHEPLVCPLQMRARSAASLRTLLSETEPVLRQAVLWEADLDEDELRRRATSAMREPRDIQARGLHIRSATWTVPLTWFSLVDPDQRHLVLGDGPHDPRRTLFWRATMPDARSRVSRARELVYNTIGDSEPARMLDDTESWLQNFDGNSAVELDYGGLVQMISDSALEADDSAEQISRILDALGAEDMSELTRLFNQVQSYWADIAAHERFN